MPTPPKSLPNIRKHLTTAERESRQAAEQKLLRNKRLYLRAPSGMSPEAKKIFRSTVDKCRGLDLLDNLDTEMLAIYADAVAKYQLMAKPLGIDYQSLNQEELIQVAMDELKRNQTAQAWARVALSFAEKLGITPTSRARLAKRKAEREVQDEFEQLLDEVTDYVNEDNV